MKKLIEYFVKYPIWANAIVVLLFAFGLLAYNFQLNKSFFPETNPRSITITMAMPGASPEEMEEGITIKIEEALKGLTGIDEVTSTSSENSATVTVRTLKNYDLDEVATEVKNAVDRINSFPVNAERPVIFKQKPRTTVLFMGLIALDDNIDLFELKEISDRIEDETVGRRSLASDDQRLSLFGNFDRSFGRKSDALRDDF